MRKYTAITCGTCGGERKKLNGAWVRERRIQMGVSLRTLAETAEVSPSYLCDIELGRRYGSEEVEQALLWALGEEKSR